MTADPLTLAELSSRDRIEALRRRMASIPARTDGAAVPAVPVEQTEARFEIRQEAATESSVERPRSSPGDRQTAPTEVASLAAPSSLWTEHHRCCSACSPRRPAAVSMPRSSDSRNWGYWPPQKWGLTWENAH